jgi:ABC-type lipoprotein export system ATPase subunit
MTIIVELKGIRKTVSMGNRKLNVLNGIDLEIKKGELVSIIGPSGSGKSALIQILGGLEFPTEGSMLIAGTQCEHLSKKQMVKWRRTNVGMVSKDDHLISSLTALQNTVLPLIFSNKGEGTDSTKRGLECLEFIGFESLASKYPQDLNDEERRAVCVARALVNDPVIVIGDEPEGNLSSHSSEKIFNILQKINQTGKTVIFTTHNTHLAIKSNRIFALLDGKITRQ